MIVVRWRGAMAPFVCVTMAGAMAPFECGECGEIVLEMDVSSLWNTTKICSHLVVPQHKIPI